MESVRAQHHQRAGSVGRPRGGMRVDVRVRWQAHVELRREQLLALQFEHLLQRLLDGVHSLASKSEVGQVLACVYMFITFPSSHGLCEACWLNL